MKAKSQDQPSCQMNLHVHIPVCMSLHNDWNTKSLPHTHRLWADFGRAVCLLSSYFYRIYLKHRPRRSWGRWGTQRTQLIHYFSLLIPNWEKAMHNDALWFRAFYQPHQLIWKHFVVKDLGCICACLYLLLSATALVIIFISNCNSFGLSLKNSDDFGGNIQQLQCSRVIFGFSIS